MRRKTTGNAGYTKPVLPDGPVEMHAVFYGAAQQEGRSARLFEDMTAAWKYGQLIGVAPVRVLVAISDVNAGDNGDSEVSGDSGVISLARRRASGA